jgi:hypothetical protein
MITSEDTALSYFSISEFKHPELIDPEAFTLLNEIRHAAGFPIVVTDDARTPEDQPEGHSETSLHLIGRAFDLRTRNLSKFQMYTLVDAILVIAVEYEVKIELELVSSSTDKHLHVGFYPKTYTGESALFIRTE